MHDETGHAVGADVAAAIDQTVQESGEVDSTHRTRHSTRALHTQCRLFSIGKNMKSRTRRGGAKRAGFINQWVEVFRTSAPHCERYAMRGHRRTAE
jgi:hypothetical protein